MKGNKEMFNTNFVFTPGKVTTTMDCSAGSSGKGKLGSFICEHADNWQFACHAFMANAAHWVILDDGSKYLYQTLASIAYLHERYEKTYICGGAVIEKDSFFRELEENGIPPHKIGIHPLTAVVQQIDVDYERGLCDIDGNYFPDRKVNENLKLGSTLHGVGAARARRILRKNNTLYARDVPELAPFICDTREEIIKRLKDGQAGLLEVAQGFQLGYLEPRFAPRTTSRNCTVAAGLDDCGIPPHYAHHVVINCRTFPIRVNSNKYVDKRSGKILTFPDMDEMRAKGEEEFIETIKGNSGACYEDQEETTWEKVTEQSGIKEIDPAAKVIEMSSLTKLPRRVYTFSKINLAEAIEYNRANGEVFISVNFANYVDARLTGVRDVLSNDVKDEEGKYTKIHKWLDENVRPIVNEHKAHLKFLGTGAKTDDMLLL